MATNAETFIEGIAKSQKKCAYEIKDILTNAIENEKENISHEIKDVIKKHFPEFQGWKISNTI